ncbi:MAG: hypothetical protein QOD67_54, partial [Caballeronia sp.]|nr:hypothetical protein [Caballeronia sp.]
MKTARLRDVLLLAGDNTAVTSQRRI